MSSRLKNPTWRINKDPEKQIDFFDGTEYDFLSNFHPSPVQIRLTATGRSADNWLECATVEHAFQAMKTTDVARRTAIAKAGSAGMAKFLGKQRDKTKLRPGWEEMKYDIMVVLLWQKFAIPELREKLLATGDATLIEGNTWGDREWGQCPLGNGRNLLGQALMMVRDEIREAEDAGTT